MVNFKIANVTSLPQDSEAGKIYVLNSGELFVGKSDNTFLPLAKDESNVKFITSLPIEADIQQDVVYILLASDSFKLYVHNGTEFIEVLSKQHNHEISDVQGLTDLLDGLIATLNNKAESALLTILSNRIDAHELGLINSEQGLHGIRLWDKKIQEWNVVDEVWVDSVVGTDLSNLEEVLDDLIKAKLEGLETAPLEHTHVIGDVTDLQDALDAKVDKSDLDTTLTDYYTNVSDNIMGIFGRLEAHEKGLINSEEGLHGVRIWDGKLEQFTNDSWLKVVDELDVTTLHLSANQILESSDKTFISSSEKAQIVDNATAIVDLSEDIVALEQHITDISDSKYATKEHTHEIANVDGLQDALDLKSDKSLVDTLTTKVTANTTEITGINAQLANGVASAIHTHPISAVNLLQDTLDAKANKTDVQSLTNNFNTHKHVINDVSELQTTLDNKALKTDFNLLKSNFDGHKHEITDVNLLQDTLANKAPLTHTHAWNQITGRPTATSTQIDNVVANSHLHSNMNILENLEDGNGVLIYNGSPLGEVAYISVETIQDRDAIPMSARKEGLMVLVIEDGGMYYLKGGVDNAFWQIFATGQGGATNALTLPANPIGNLTGTNAQALIDQLESRKADKNEVYSKAEMTTFMENYPIDYLTLENLPNLSQLHWHENLETLNLFNQYQGNLTWKGKTLGDLMTEIYDADKDGIIDVAARLNGLISTITELNYLSGSTGNIQSQINAISSGVTFRGEYATFADMLLDIPSPNKGDLVYIKTDENKGNAVDTQYCFDGTDWIYGGGTTKTPEATLTTKGILQLGGDLAHPSSTANAPKLTPTGVNQGLYKSANITVGEDGRILHAEEGSVIFLNDTIVSEDEGWSSNKINEELQKLSPRNHTHPQLHDANKLGNVTLDETISPENNMTIAYDSITGKAKWTEQEGGRVYVGSKSIKGDYTLKAGSYITLLVDEETKEITISSTYRDGGGTSLIPSGLEIVHTVTVPANSKERFSVEAGFNKIMLHTVQMSSDKNVVGELRIYNQSSDGFIEYNSNPEMFISDIVNIPIFDYDNSKMMHLEVVNNGIDEAKFKIRMKVTNLQ